MAARITDSSAPASYAYPLLLRGSPVLDAVYPAHLTDRMGAPSALMEGLHAGGFAAGWRISTALLPASTSTAAAATLIHATGGDCTGVCRPVVYSPAKGWAGTVDAHYRVGCRTDPLAMLFNRKDDEVSSIPYPRQRQQGESYVHNCTR